MFKTNVGDADRIVRVAIAAVLLALTLLQIIPIWGLVGLIPLATGVSGFCPLYTVFGIRTCSAPKSGA